MKDVRILGVDLGKNSCSIVGLDGAGRVLLRRRTRREGVIALAAKLPGCVVAMEACCGAHHLGRAWRDGSTEPPAPIRRPSDHSRNASRAGRPSLDVPASTSGTSESGAAQAITS